MRRFCLPLPVRGKSWRFSAGNEPARESINKLRSDLRVHEVDHRGIHHADPRLRSHEVTPWSRMLVEPSVHVVDLRAKAAGRHRNADADWEAVVGVLLLRERAADDWLA